MNGDDDFDNDLGSNGHNGQNGHAASGPASEVPPNIAELTVACQNYVHQALGTALDFTPETLPLLDHYIGRAREDLIGRPEVAELTVRAVGAYFGEVFRRHIGGLWLLTESSVQDWLVCGRHVFLSFNPVGAAYDAVYESSEHPGPSGRMRFALDERDLVLARLGAIEVPEDEYYLLSTRLEAIEIANDALRAHLEAKGYGDMEFGEDDYLQEMRPL